MTNKIARGLKNENEKEINKKPAKRREMEKENGKWQVFGDDKLSA